MPTRHEKFSIAIVIIATLSLPLLSVASVENTFKNASNSFISLGAKIDQGVLLMLSIPFHTSHTLDQGVNAVENVASSMYHVSRTQITNLKFQITHKFQITKTQTTNAIERHHSMLRSPAMSGAGIHRMLGAGSDAIKNTTRNTLSSFTLPRNDDEKQTAIYASTSQLANKNKTEPAVETQPPPSKREKEERSSPTLIERVIERVTTVKEVLTPAIVSSDSRVNKLITDVADLTSRIDEKDGSPYRNSALFNMISQSQRIKTLDDVKITNATIEGYATSKGVSDSLATYLPLGGHTHGRINRNLSYSL